MVRYCILLTSMLFFQHVFGQQAGVVQKIPNLTALTASQVQDFNKIAQHERFLVTQLVQLNPLSTGINTSGNLLIGLSPELMQAGECQNLEFRPKTSRYVDDQNYYYYGQLERGDTTICNCDCQSGEILLEAIDGIKYGYIRVDDIQYEIHAINSTYSLLGKVNLNYYNDFQECLSFEEPEPEKPEITQDVAISVDVRSGVPCEVKVLFLYTPAALADHSFFGLNNITNLAISQTNQALQNSSVSNVRASKAALLQLPDFVEDEQNINGDMANLIASPEANNLRMAYSADVVCLVTGTTYTLAGGGTILGASGFQPAVGGGLVTNLGAPMFDLAFMLVEANSISANYTFSHEFGHVLGCRHQTCDIFLNGGCDSNGTIEHGHGWGEKKCGLCKWRGYSTMMHQIRNGNQRLLNYSNPIVTHNGYVTGIDGESNNAGWISGTGGCIVSNYFVDPMPTLLASISGEEILCKPNSGNYTVLTSIPGNYTFQWHKSTNGINWGQPIGTGQNVTLSSANHTIGQTVFLRATVLSPGNLPLYAFFEVLIADPNDANCPRTNNPVSEVEGSVSVFPNPSEGSFNLMYRVEEEAVRVRVQLFSITGNLLYETQHTANSGAYEEQINTENLIAGVLLLQIQIGEKHYNKLLIKQ